MSESLGLFVRDDNSGALCYFNPNTGDVHPLTENGRPMIVDENMNLVRIPDIKLRWSYILDGGDYCSMKEASNDK